MKALGEPHSGRNPLFGMALTRHASTVANTRARVVDTGYKAEQLHQVRADVSTCARLLGFGMNRPDWIEVLDGITHSSPQTI